MSWPNEFQQFIVRPIIWRDIKSEIAPWVVSKTIRFPLYCSTKAKRNYRSSWLTICEIICSFVFTRNCDTTWILSHVLQVRDRERDERFTSRRRRRREDLPSSFKLYFFEARQLDKTIFTPSLFDHQDEMSKSYWSPRAYQRRILILSDGFQPSYRLESRQLHCISWHWSWFPTLTVSEKKSQCSFWENIYKILNFSTTTHNFWTSLIVRRSNFLL